MEASSVGSQASPATVQSGVSDEDFAVGRQVRRNAHAVSNRPSIREDVPHGALQPLQDQLQLAKGDRLLPVLQPEQRRGRHSRLARELHKRHPAPLFAKELTEPLVERWTHEWDSEMNPMPDAE